MDSGLAWVIQAALQHLRVLDCGEGSCYQVAMVCLVQVKEFWEDTLPVMQVRPRLLPPSLSSPILPSLLSYTPSSLFFSLPTSSFLSKNRKKFSWEVSLNALCEATYFWQSLLSGDEAFIFSNIPPPLLCLSLYRAEVTRKLPLSCTHVSIWWEASQKISFSSVTTAAPSRRS